MKPESVSTVIIPIFILYVVENGESPTRSPACATSLSFGPCITTLDRHSSPNLCILTLCSPGCLSCSSPKKLPLVFFCGSTIPSSFSSTMSRNETAHRP